MSLRETIILIALAFAIITPSAIAQEDPTVNESDYNTSDPAADESYLDDAEQESTSNGTEDPTLSESDFDTTPPAADESYLDDAEQEASTDGSGADDTRAGAPGLPLVGALAALAGVGLLLRRR